MPWVCGMIWRPRRPTGSQVSRITDGGFEEAITYGPDTVFGWQVKTVPQTQIGIDPNTWHGGGRSLRMMFQVRTQLDATLAAQLVTVVPDASYDFECFVKTAKFQSGGPLTIQILDANQGTSHWPHRNPLRMAITTGIRVALPFKSGAKTEAVTVKIVRGGCRRRYGVSDLWKRLRMTTSVSTDATSVVIADSSPLSVPAPSREHAVYKIRHSLASRFVFLVICVGIVMSALAFRNRSLLGFGPLQSWRADDSDPMGD